MKLEYIALVLAVALTGLFGFGVLGGGFDRAVAGNAGSRAVSSRALDGVSGPVGVVSAQAGALTDLARLGSLNPLINPLINPIGYALARRAGLLPLEVLQSVHHWLPGRGTAEYATLVGEARKLLDPAHPGVVRLETAKYVPQGLLKELYSGFALPVAGKGRTYVPGVFVESYAEWITMLTNDAFGAELGELQTPFRGLTAGTFQRSKKGQILNGAAHMDTGPSVVSIFTLDGPPTRFETAEHFRARAGAKGAPDVRDMIALSETGDITLHRATGFEGADAIYHRSPFQEEFGPADERAVIIASVATQEQLPTARAQLRQQILDGLQPGK